MSGVIICRSDTFPLRRIIHCPTCKRRRRFAGVDRGAWYGVIWTCCGCGDSWGDGERLPRPFKRGWRTEAKSAAKHTWAAAEGRTRDEHRAWIRAQLGDDVAEERRTQAEATS